LNGSDNFNYFDGEPDPGWIVEPGELLFAWAGVAGVSFGPTIWPGPRGVLNQHIYRITPYEGIDKDWLYAALKEVTSRIERKAHGFKSSLLHVKKNDITEQHIYQPKSEEQKEIARIIAVGDRSIDLTERLIAAKQERRSWLMQQLLTGKKRLPGFDDEWQEIHIRDICMPVRRKNDKGVTHVLTASGEHGLVDQMEYFNRSVSGESLDGYFLLRRGEFAYNRSSMNGYPYGAIKRLDAYDEGVLSTLYICFRLTSESCFSDFYKHLFEAGILNRQLREVVQVGARAHGLLNITLHDFFSLKICCPPIEEQQHIAAIIDTADRELDLLRTQLDALREQKKGLMQQLLTGKVRVKTGGTNV
jgi:type I restriction enzyme S subunit